MRRLTKQTAVAYDGAAPQPCPEPEPCTAARPGHVLGLLGASGGVGATTLAAACAVRAALAGVQVVLVDAAPWSGGIEVRTGTDADAGLRWPDLVGARGDLDGRRLIADLPGTDLRCLSWDGTAPPAEPPGPHPVVRALRAATELVVVDLPRAGATGAVPWWEACDDVLLVLDAGVSGLPAAAVTAPHVAPLTGAVVRRPGGVGREAVARVTGVPVLAEVGPDRSVDGALVVGNPVGKAPGALADAADGLLAALLPGGRVAG